MGWAGAGGPSKKSLEEEFSPKGIRVLAVDDDIVCLRILRQILLSVGAKVTISRHPWTALQLLRENKGCYDLVVTDVMMPEMDGHQLAEIVDNEMGLPVIMISASDDMKTVIKGIRHGACDYLLKPALQKDFKLIYKHIIKKSLVDAEVMNNDTNKLVTASKSEGNTSEPTGKSDNQINNIEDDISYALDEGHSQGKRPRISWNKERHSRFIHAINIIGLDKAVPKKILELMDTPELTRNNVASHLQKFRKTLTLQTMENGNQNDGTICSNGPGANIGNCVFSSFGNQDLDVGSHGEFRVEGYQNFQRTIPFAHAQRQCRLGLLNQTGSPHPFGHQTNQLLKQYPSTAQTSQFRSKHSALIPSVMEMGSHQTTSNYASYQSLVPRFNQPSGFMDNSSNQWLNGRNSCSTSVNIHGHASNFQGLNPMFTQNSQVYMDKTIAGGSNRFTPMQHQQYQQYQFNSGTGANFGLGNHIRGDALNPQYSRENQSNVATSQLEQLAPHRDPSQGESMLHLTDTCTDDDILTAFTRFLSPGKTPDGDRLQP